MVVEGSLTSGQDVGLSNASRLAEGLMRDHELAVEITVAAKVNDAIISAWQNKTNVPIRFLGAIPREQIPFNNRSAHIFFSAEVNSACPNSVIEALSCGLPVVGFDTGALAEIITPEAGIIAPYGADVWKLQPPHVDELIAPVARLLADLPRYQQGARRRAEKAFGLDLMVDKYLEVLLT